MRFLEKIKVLAKRTRAIVFPITDIPSHLRSQVKSTSKELGFQSDVILALESFTVDTCKESGLDVLKE